jgi:hypothetical protein
VSIEILDGLRKIAVPVESVFWEKQRESALSHDVPKVFSTGPVEELLGKVSAK